MTIIKSFADATAIIADLIKKATENSLDIISSKNSSLMLSELKKLSQNPEHQVINYYTEQLMKQNGLLNEDGTVNNFVKIAIDVETLEQANFSPFAFEISTNDSFFDVSWFWAWWQNNDSE